jgi:hypothetical protein
MFAHLGSELIAIMLNDRYDLFSALNIDESVNLLSPDIQTLTQSPLWLINLVLDDRKPATLGVRFILYVVLTNEYDKNSRLDIWSRTA